MTRHSQGMSAVDLLFRIFVYLGVRRALERSLLAPSDPPNEDGQFEIGFLSPGG